MFGNKNSRQEQQHIQNQQLMQQSQGAQAQGNPQPPLVQYQKQDSKRIDELEENTNAYLKEVMGVVTEVAARIQAIEENKTPQMNAFTEQKRLSVIEQNLNQYNLQFNGIIDFIKNQQNQINSIMNLFYQLFPKKMDELERKANGEEVKKDKKTRAEKKEEAAEKAKQAKIEESELF